MPSWNSVPSEFKNSILNISSVYNIINKYPSFIQLGEKRAKESSQSGVHFL